MRRILFFILILFSALVVISGVFPWLYKLQSRPYAVRWSPDMRFRLEYHAIPFVPFKPHHYIGMGCTDCPGFVRLVDTANHRTLEEAYFETRHEISGGVQWEPHEVGIKVFAVWPLPE